MSLLRNIRISSLMGATTGTAAATTEAVGIVDMAGWGGLLVLGISPTTSWGTAQDMFLKEAATTAATFLSLEVGGAVASGANTDSAVGRSILAIDAKKVNDRYVQVGFTSGTVGDIELVIAIQYDPLEAAVAQSTANQIYDPIIPGNIAVVASPTTA